MRILIVTDTFLPEINGAAISIERSVQLLAKKYEIMIICPKYPHSFKDNTSHKLNKNITIVRISSIPLLSYTTVRISLPWFNGIKQKVNKFNPTIIHIHTPGTLGLYFLNRTWNCKKIATFHTLLTEQVKYVWKGPSRFLEMIIWKGLIKYYNKADCIITPSTIIKKLILEKGIKKPIDVVSNGITKHIPKKDYSINNSLLHFGRISYEKKIDVLLKAMRLVKKKIPNILLTIIGDGPDKNRLIGIVKKLKLEKNVTFKGWIPNKELNQEILHYDAFVTSSTMETQGIALLESMASGLPVIGVKKYAIPELIKYNNIQNGFLVEPDNPKQFANAIITLLTTNKQKEFGKNSIKIAQQHDIYKIIKQLEKLYALN